MIHFTFSTKCVHFRESMENKPRVAMVSHIQQLFMYPCTWVMVSLRNADNKVVFIHLYNLPRMEGITGVLCIFVTIGERFEPGQTDLFFTL